jgi:hypothetical protein
MAAQESGLMGKFYEYSGLDYEQASRAAEKLLARGWYRNFERLAALREIMQWHHARS